MSNIREVVSINFGHCGMRIGDYCCQLFAQEHKINTDQETANPFFDKTPQGKTTPNSIFADMDPYTVNQVRSGRSRDLYEDEFFVSGVEDGGFNYARGYFLINEKIMEEMQDRIRKITESKSNFQGFLVTHSTGGGTGSGFLNLMMEDIRAEYSKKTKISFSVLPGELLSKSPMEIYNTALFLNNSEFFDVTFLFDNDTVRRLCESHLRLPHPELRDLNEVIAQTISSITASVRFDGGMNKLLKEFPRTLVPYPVMRFPIPAYAPLLEGPPKSVDEMSAEMLKPGNQMTDVDLPDSKCITCCYLYRGGIKMATANQAIKNIKTKKLLNFSSMPYDAYKVSVVKQPAVRLQDSRMPTSILQQSACVLTNGNAFADIFQKLSERFDPLLKEQAYVHWLVQEGLEEDVLKHAGRYLKNAKEECMHYLQD